MYSHNNEVVNLVCMSYQYERLTPSSYFFYIGLRCMPVSRRFNTTPVLVITLSAVFVEQIEIFTIT